MEANRDSDHKSNNPEPKPTANQSESIKTWERKLIKHLREGRALLAEFESKIHVFQRQRPALQSKNMPELVDHSIGNFEVNEYEITALLTQQLSDYLHYRIEDERTKGLRFQRTLCGDADEIQRLKDCAEKTLKGVNEALFEFYRAYESDPELEHTNEAIEAYKKARKGDRVVALFEFLKLAPELGFSFSLTGAHHKDELLVPSAADLLLSVSGIQKMDDDKPQVRIIPGSALHEDAVKVINIARSRL